MDSENNSVAELAQVWWVPKAAARFRVGIRIRRVHFALTCRQPQARIRGGNGSIPGYYIKVNDRNPEFGLSAYAYANANRGSLLLYYSDIISFLHQTYSLSIDPHSKPILS
jgi:hypothetical protein